MKGSEAQLLGFLEGSNNRYVIPVYQRKYDWKINQCRQLFDDLKKLVAEGRKSHFFGSIVSQIVPGGSKIEFHIIDGQQRLTTVILLLLAICNLIRNGKVQAIQSQLDEQIMERFIIDKWPGNDSRIKLRPVEKDWSALEKLVAGDETEFERTSNLTVNYQYFFERIQQEEISVDSLYQAVGGLQIISITLDQDDDPQLIFESLNSTGLALTEGDKIRNYILMGLSPEKQEAYYNGYWTKIEGCTGNDVSPFVRDYLSIKEQMTPAISNVYQAFKKYVETEKVSLDVLLEDMKKYARIYQKLLSGNSGLGNVQLDDCMYRLKRLQITVTEPFFMEIFRLEQEGKLTADELARIFQITESYLFRRNICDVPTNALNKVFLNLNREILRYNHTTADYVNKLAYVLLAKKESGRFPRDDEFSQALANKAVYQMRGKYKAYLFERLENYGTMETKDVYTLLDNGTYSIEHIMPQHLTPTWNQELGPETEEIHSIWLHRLGNLTLTAYNPNMSNGSFQEKRDGAKGYKNSGLRMNQRIAAKNQWGLAEIQERNEKMVALATQSIWALPITTFKPAVKEFDTCTLDEEDAELTGRYIVKFSYRNAETPVSSWTDMFDHVVKYLHGEDRTILPALAEGDYETENLGAYFSSKPDGMRTPLQIDDNLYVEKNTSTMLKVSILRRLFGLFHKDPLDLVFYLRETGGAGNQEEADKDRFFQLACQWAEKKTEAGIIQAELNPANHTYIRFKTKEMSAILPDTVELSGWNTPNHYYYQLSTRRGDSSYIVLCLSSRNLPAEQRESCHRMIKLSSGKEEPTDWLWKTVFRTNTVKFDAGLTEETVFQQLDHALAEVLEKQKNLLQKLTRKDRAE